MENNSVNVEELIKKLLNENDSEKIAGMLVECGYQQAEKEADADIIVFNTCCIRENAEKTLFGVLRRS